MENIFDLTGKVAVITGAGGVLCGEMAKALGAAGAKVAVLDLSEEAAKKVADEINENRGHPCQRHAGAGRTEDRRQEIEGRRQETEDWRQGAEDRRQKIQDRRQNERRKRQGR
jgi:NAD(P)-dependent dehydrogenase (short-subunit alcohol dehydrogenase family)